MGRKAKQQELAIDERSACDGNVVLFKRSNSKRWQARIRHYTGKWVPCSTGTDDLSEATAIATSKYNDVSKALSAGELTITRRFQDVGQKEVKNELGRLISPRPKQKFGTDKIMAKIDEFLAHEQEPDYFEKLLEKQLVGVSEAKKRELLEKRRTYSNNKNVYSLLMQYAAGFGKSNIIGWSALQLKDLRRLDHDGKMQYVYDKIMIVVDRLQLRSQIDSLMLNMNIDRRMVLEAT